MADVSYSKAYRNKLLEKISLAKMNDSTMFVATKIAPFVQVTQPT